MVAPSLNGLCVSVLLCAALVLPACDSRPEQPVTTNTAEDPAPFSVSQIELPFRACSKPQRVGSSIYTAVSRGVDKGSSIIRYDTKTGRTETIVEAPDPDLIGWFVVNDEWLVYSVAEALYARPRIGGKAWVLSRRRELYAPALEGDLVAWDDLAEDRTHQIVLHDLRSRTSTVVAPVELADLYNNFVAWDGSQLVWTDVRRHDGSLPVLRRKHGHHGRPHARYRQVPLSRIPATGSAAHLLDQLRRHRRVGLGHPEGRLLLACRTPIRPAGRQALRGELARRGGRTRRDHRQQPTADGSKSRCSARPGVPTGQGSGRLRPAIGRWRSHRFA